MEKDPRLKKQQLEEELHDLNWELQQAPNNASIMARQAKLVHDLLVLTKSIERSRSYALAYDDGFVGRNKEAQNPPIDILVNVYKDGKHLTPSHNEYMRVDRDLNLAVEVKKVDKAKIETLKNKIGRMRVDYQNHMTRQVQEEIKKTIEAISAETLPFTPHFYLTLGKNATDLAAFTMAYAGKSKNRSKDNVEANIAALLRILFERKEIRVNKERCQIIKYSWSKGTFPPYGYQTSREYVAVRTIPKAPRITFASGESIHSIIDAMFSTTEVAVAGQAPGTSEAEGVIDGILLNQYRRDLESAIKQYTGFFGGEPNISFANYSTPSDLTDLFYTTVLKAEQRTDLFVRGYLAYRFSIYNTFFDSTPWDYYSKNPYFVSVKKNSALLERLMPLAPTQELREQVGVLLGHWVEEDKAEYARITTLQHKTQMLYVQRLYTQLQLRLYFLHIGINYSVLQVILKKAIRCHADALKDATIQCFSKISQKATLNYLRVPQPTERVGIDAYEDFECDSADQAATMPELGGGYTIHSSGNVSIPVDADEYETDETTSIQALDALINKAKADKAVKLYVSVQHRLPACVECVFRRRQYSQMRKYVEDMQTELTNWTSAHANIIEENQHLAAQLDEICLDSVTEILNTGEACIDRIKAAHQRVSMIAAHYLRYANPADAGVTYHVLEQPYDEWYAPLNDLQEKHKVVAQQFVDVVADLREAVMDVQSRDDKYQLGINQLDYAIDAFEYISEIHPRIEPVDITPFCKNSANMAVAERYLSVLDDLVANRPLRGTTWYADFQMPAPTCPANQAVLIDKIINGTPTLADFENLKAECVVAHVGEIDYTDAGTCRALYESAVKFIREGRIRIGRKYLHFAICFHFDDLALFNDCRRLLANACMTMGEQLDPSLAANDEAWKRLKKDFMAQNQDLSDEFGERDPAWKRLKAVFTHGVGDEFGLFTTIRGVVRGNQAFLERETARARQTDPRAKVENSPDVELKLLCMSAYANAKTVYALFRRLNQMYGKQVEPHRQAIMTLLPYFQNHNVMTDIVVNVHDAMRHVGYPITYEFIANHVLAHFGHMDPLPSDDCRPLKLTQEIFSLDKVLDRLARAKKLIEKVKTERENNWPNELSGTRRGVLSMARSGDYPYVDGNYIIRVVVDLELTTKETPHPESCEDKFIAANELADILLKRH